MENPELLNDVRFLRDVVAKTQPSVNHFWPVTLSWGCVITFGYVLCGILARNGNMAVLPWVWPVLIFLVAWPLQWFLVRRVRAGLAETGVRPRFRRDLALCWTAITAVGLLWTVGLIVSGRIVGDGYLLLFAWGSLYFIGYIMNGFLLSAEWFWAAGVLLVSVIAAFLAGPEWYWMPGIWIGGSFILAGLLGRRNARIRI